MPETAGGGEIQRDSKPKVVGESAGPGVPSWEHDHHAWGLGGMAFRV